ncbi:MAG TPA: transglycosylase SLT domain-containing protein [Candidatus Tumulicola sp.]|jgi:hypothetical protein
MNVDSIASRLASQGVAFAPEIAGAARRHRLDPELLAAVAAQETGGPDSNSGHNVVGDGGHGRGVFQIDDRWHAFARTPEAMDPDRNADYAAGMLSGLLGRYGGDVHEALSAYNAGSPKAEGTRTQWSDGRDLGYADSVLRHYARLTGEQPASGPSPASAAPPHVLAPEPANPDGQSVLDQLSALIASLGALESPMLQPPQPPQMPQSYQQQVIDYAGLLDTTQTTDLTQGAMTWLFFYPSSKESAAGSWATPSGARSAALRAASKTER